MNDDLTTLESRIAWPLPATMRTYYLKLLANPGSVVLLALEAPRGPDGPQWKLAWLSATERSAIRKAVVKLNEKRVKQKQPTTDQLPNEESNSSD
jgi:hypothetical protein